MTKYLLFPCDIHTMMIVFLLLSFAVNALCNTDTLVVTKHGPVTGVDKGNYTTFFGIPYALVDEKNPFGVSLPYPNFTSPFTATDSSVKCPQLTSNSSGDGMLQCLRLNIFVPKTTNKKLPVFVWIHGGGFIFGSAGDYDGKYLVQHDIIVVTINYRLGPYGFFCLETDDVPGNQGLKDQVTALKWVKRNIKAFGGDPNKVTIAGESYGGGSVELHLYSEAKKHYDKAIIQSGGVDTEALIVQSNKDAAYKLAKVFEPNVEREESLTVLAKQGPTEVMNAFRSSGLLLRACKEKIVAGKNKNFITEHSLDFYAPHKVNDMPILIGYNSKETFGDFMRATDSQYEIDIFLQKIKNSFSMEEKLLEEAVDSVKKFYLGNKNISKDVMMELIDFTSDFMVNYPEERAVTRFLNQNAVVYKYLFSYTGNSPYKDVEGVGAQHTEELQYLFQFGTSEELSGEDNILMRDRMTAMWANFVKYGNPTPKGTNLLTVQWQKARKLSRFYMDIDKVMKMKNNVYQNRMDFWNTFWQKYGHYRKPYPSALEN